MAPQNPTRRGFLGQTGVLGAAALAGPTNAQATPTREPRLDTEPFHGPHQAGIVTPAQRHLQFAVFDVVADTRADLLALLQRWTLAAARLSAGQPADDNPAADAVTAGLGPARLTITVGFGAGLFAHDGRDRFGLAARRPEALIDLPKFYGDQLLPERTGGDLCLQICADDAQVALDAMRQLARIGGTAIAWRWVQAGFGAAPRGGGTPRNLMGFKDGTMNPDPRDPAAMARHVWVGSEGGWMTGGSYLVARPIRIALEKWERMKPAFQEQVIGRHKTSGAPLGRDDEFAPLDLNATDADGNPRIPENSHVRLGAPEINNGAQILRRAFSYDNGVAQIAERWPPWTQGVMRDAGLMFLGWQRDPRSGFVAIFQDMAKFDMLNQFTTHTGSGLFACPPGVRPGGWWGETLFAA